MKANCVIRDKHVLRKIDRVRKQRQQATMARTARDLILERIAQLGIPETNHARS